MPVTVKRTHSILTAITEYEAARARLDELTPLKEQIRAAEQAVEAAKSAVRKADSVNYLRAIVWAAEGKGVKFDKSGSKAWAKEGAWRLVYHANECGWWDITGDTAYRKKHDKCLATVTCVSYGPKHIGVWYTANGKTHWLAMGHERSLSERFSLTDGTTTVAIEPPKPSIARK